MLCNKHARYITLCNMLAGTKSLDKARDQIDDVWRTFGFFAKEVYVITNWYEKEKNEFHFSRWIWYTSLHQNILCW